MDTALKGSKQLLEVSAHAKIANDVNQQMGQTDNIEDKIVLSMMNDMLVGNDASNRNSNM